VAGITYNFLPFTALPLYVALERIDKRLVEAAKDLYASRWQAFRKVVWPLSLPGVFAALLLTFVPATGDYVNASLLGGPGTTMIGNIIQEKFLTNVHSSRRRCPSSWSRRWSSGVDCEGPGDRGRMAAARV
jgi:spermidine/putrescine transport system permease protein